jgi:hypothetical protein
MRKDGTAGSGYAVQAMGSPAKRRPLRYRGINLRSEKERPRLAVGTAALLTAVSALALYALDGFIVEITQGHTHKPGFWFAFAVTLGVAVWAVRRMIRSWRRMAERRRGGPTSSN